VSDHVSERRIRDIDKPSGLSTASWLGIVLGFAYGLIARFIAGTTQFSNTFGVMTLAFFIVVPLVLGVLTVWQADAPSWWFRIFAPWVPVLLVVAAVWALGWEGRICIVMGLPVFLILASLGGITTAARQMRRGPALPVLVTLPYLVAPLEQRIPPPQRLAETVTEIEIAAPPSVVWPLIASVDSIRPEEERPALYLALGFPKPISATLSRPGVGGIRSARFERGLTFTETITEWMPDRRLSFRIDVNTESVPPTALDPHVMIGGPYFDVLTGTYELYPIDRGRSTRLVLRSTHRLSTRFNVYADWWVERVMRSIQMHICEIHKARAQRFRG
jgi:hypothetical protein